MTAAAAVEVGTTKDLLGSENRTRKTPTRKEDLEPFGTPKMEEEVSVETGTGVADEDGSGCYSYSRETVDLGGCSTHWSITKRWMSTRLRDRIPEPTVEEGGRRTRITVEGDSGGSRKTMMMKDR